MGALERGQRVEVRSDALPDKRFTAILDAIDPLVDQNGRALVLRARLENIGGELRPGMFVQTRVILAQRESALLIPEEAIVAVGGEQRVYLIGSDNKVTQRTVTTGLRRDGQVEITDGLREGDLVVTAGHLKLRPGALVRVDEKPSTVAEPGKASAAPAASRRIARNAS
jgi:membrane fusion protein (multidrug efflux system)